jgi:uncharacterized protein YceK
MRSVRIARFLVTASVMMLSGCSSIGNRAMRTSGVDEVPAVFYPGWSFLPNPSKK